MDDEEHTGPSLDSDDPEERILARRLRIQRRQEAQKRALLGEDKDESKEVEQQQTIGQKQMEDSHVRLRKLHEDGFEMVTNVRVAGDAREVARRIEEEEARRQRKEKLEAEAKAGAERFEEITKKWESALQKEIPQDLHEMLTQQKSACDAMLDEKNKLITDYQSELKAKDDQYVRDLKKQAEDIDLLIERMENQVKELTKAYRHELEEIERAFVMERMEMLDRQNKKWEQMMNERRQKEIDYMAEREKRVEEFEQQLQHIRIQDAEEYNQVKIKLETDVQILQQQLQQMKATYQLNQEKLEYNFQVLRKRDEENTITKSQQKRKITRLHDVLTNLKRKLGKQEKTYKDDNQSLTADYKHQLDQFKDVQKKAKTFMGSDAKKFNEIWAMNEEECKRLASRILEAERIIHEQQLGLEWTTPNTEFMNNTGPLKSKKDIEKSKGSSAKKMAQHVIKTDKGTTPFDPEHSSSTVHRGEGAEGDDNELMSASAVASSQMPLGSSPAAAAVVSFSPQLIKQILELLCDESGFLIESKLLTLLAPLNPCEQTLMKLDAIFMAMGIESEEDVQALTRYFIKYRKSEVSSHQGLQLGSTISSQMPEEDDADVHEQCDKPDNPDMEPLEMPDENKGSTTSGRVEGESQAEPVPELIESNDVLKALKAFVEENNKHRSHKPVDITTWLNITAEDSKIAEAAAAISAAASDSAPAASHKEKDLPTSEGQAAKPQSGAGVTIGKTAAMLNVEAIVAATSREPKPITEMQKLLFQKSQMASQFTIVNTNERDDSEDAAYWAKYQHVVSDEQEKVWDALIYSFDKYYDVLTSRSKLIEETDGLRQQNAELRLLLHQYVNSKVNQELQIPPTRVLQF